MKSSIKLATALLGGAYGQTVFEYNESMKYLFADLAPSFPCHFLYEYKTTYFNMSTDESNWNSIAVVLAGLKASGFNGIRLPMFPESDQVSGEDPDTGSFGPQIGWE